MLELNLNLCSLFEFILTNPRFRSFWFKSIEGEILSLAFVLIVLFMYAIHSSFHVILFLYYGIILMHASHSYITVIETPENELVEPAATVEPEPGVEFIVEPEENQSKEPA
jgi:hypothetical protein